jgi:hypothetical protein
MNLQAMRMPAAVGIIAVIGVAAYFQLRSDPQGAPQFSPVATGGGAESDTAGAAAVVDLRLGDLRAPVPEIAAADRNPFRFNTGEAPMGATAEVAGPARDLPKDAPERAESAPAGRLDMALVRIADGTGASGVGLLSAVLFDAVGAGAAALTIAGSGSIPGGTAVPLDFSPIAVTVS